MREVIDVALGEAFISAVVEPKHGQRVINVKGIVAVWYGLHRLVMIWLCAHTSATIAQMGRPSAHQIHLGRQGGRGTVSSGKIPEARSSVARVGPGV